SANSAQVSVRPPSMRAVSPGLEAAWMAMTSMHEHCSDRSVTRPCLEGVGHPGPVAAGEHHPALADAPTPPRHGTFRILTRRFAEAIDPQTGSARLAVHSTAMPRTVVSASLPHRWKRVLATGNPPSGPLDPVTRWLVLTRAAVLPMTLTAAARAGLLAVGRPGF